MILITSAAYTSPGLVSEFGLLPPSMLPVQNRRLYEHQVAMLRGIGQPIYLSLPASYELPRFDAQQLASLNVNVIAVPDDLSLGQSVAYCLNYGGCFDEPLYILHGDTLFASVDAVEDSYVVGEAEDNYSWAHTSQNQSGEVYAGFFGFSSPRLLIKKITEQGYKFIKGVEAYGEERPLRAMANQGWMDFGLVNAYYRSSSKLTTQRVFNNLRSNRYSFVKSSRDIKKMLAEVNWITSLPKELKHYAPAVWDYGIDGDSAYYEIEYYYLSTLANLYVFGKNPIFVWNDILSSCSQFIDDIAQYRPLAHEARAIAHRNDDLYLPKTRMRLQDYATATGISLDHPWTINGVTTPSLNEIIEVTGAMITPNDERFATLMHGDFCFSNILYDFKSKSIKVIDPRGLDLDGNKSVYGDLRYDVGKLAHSLIGMYDFIIGGVYSYADNAPYDVSLQFEQSSDIQQLQQAFRNHRFAGYDITELSTYPILVHLFLSMLPLHSDHPERQKAMLANALRLYVELKNLPSS